MTEKEKTNARWHRWFLKNRESVYARQATYRAKLSPTVKREHNIRAMLRRYYDMTLEAWFAMYKAQSGRCANPGCRTSMPSILDRGASLEKANVDHCHQTKLVRGLLCKGCNIALAMLKESPDRMRGLATYKEASLQTSAEF